MESTQIFPVGSHITFETQPLLEFRHKYRPTQSFTALLSPLPVPLPLYSLYNLVSINYSCSSWACNTSYFSSAKSTLQRPVRKLSRYTRGRSSLRKAEIEGLASYHRSALPKVLAFAEGFDQQHREGRPGTCTVDGRTYTRF